MYNDAATKKEIKDSDDPRLPSPITGYPPDMDLKESPFHADKVMKYFTLQNGKKFFAVKEVELGVNQGYVFGCCVFWFVLSVSLYYFTLYVLHSNPYQTQTNLFVEPS